MSYRTDLALECKQIYDEERGCTGDIDGISVAKIRYDEDVVATRIEVIDERGEKALKKPIGHYITLEIDGITDEKPGIKDRAAAALASELSSLVPFRSANLYTGAKESCGTALKVLVAGLGNDRVTPDSLGPRAAAQVKITRHMFWMFDAEDHEAISCVSGFIPGVTGSTGMETAELVEQAVKISNPEVVIVIDALAARDINRISTTIQINDTGISPGGGIGNSRKEICEKTLGRRVIAIGVPTVIDSRTLILDTLHDYKKDPEEIKQYITQNGRDMIVTSTDIDQIIKDFSDIISNGINRTLHPGIYS